MFEVAISPSWCPFHRGNLAALTTTSIRTVLPTTKTKRSNPQQQHARRTLRGEREKEREREREREREKRTRRKKRWTAKREGRLKSRGRYGNRTVGERRPGGGGDEEAEAGGESERETHGETTPAPRPPAVALFYCALRAKHLAIFRFYVCVFCVFVSFCFLVIGY